MKKIIIMILFSFLSIKGFAEDIQTIPYKDLTVEHWAYKSIETLYKKGILDIKSDIFNGEKNINRFEMAYFLSKTLNQIENEKADRNDLVVIEHIVYEFSEELTKFGFDSKSYLQKVDSFEAKLEENRISNENNKNNIEKLDTRVEELEKTLNRKNQFLGQSLSENDKFKFLNNFNLYLKSNIDYKLNDSENSFKGAHQLGLAFKRENYELFLESETSDKEAKNGELLVKGQIESNVIKGYSLNFHTSDYERYFKSYFNNIIYDNHNSYEYTVNNKTYQYDSFDSYGLALANENIGIYIEKTRSDYDNNFSDNNAYGVTVDESFSDTFNFISKLDYKYFDALVIKNGNNENLDFEVDGKYPINKFQLTLAYSEKIGNDRTLTGISDTVAETYDLYFNKLSFINGEMAYGGKSNLTFGFEIKSDENDNIYNLYYTSYKYNLGKNGKIKYKYEYLDRENDDKNYQNHYFVINVDGEKLNTYGACNIIRLNKNYLVNNNSLYPYEENYNETMIKSTYKVNDKIFAKIGYLLRNYKADIDNSEISFIQMQYNMDSSTLFYLKYIKNTGLDYNDRILDIDNNMVDLDFDSNTGVIREAEGGRIELGVELTF